jgi:hypothetical protein
MNLLGAIKYILSSAVIVISLFLAFRGLFANDMRREIWRLSVKRRIYISQRRFKTITVTAGWLFLFLALIVAYWEIIGLLEP